MTAYLTEKDVETITGRKIPTLRKDRLQGRGIPYLKVGRQIRYRQTDVENFMDACLVDVQPLQGAA